MENLDQMVRGDNIFLGLKEEDICPDRCEGILDKENFKQHCSKDYENCPYPLGNDKSSNQKNF